MKKDKKVAGQTRTFIKRLHEFCDILDVQIKAAQDEATFDPAVCSEYTVSSWAGASSYRAQQLAKRWRRAHGDARLIELLEQWPEHDELFEACTRELDSWVDIALEYRQRLKQPGLDAEARGSLTEQYRHACACAFIEAQSLRSMRETVWDMLTKLEALPPEAFVNKTLNESDKK